MQGRVISSSMETTVDDMNWVRIIDSSRMKPLPISEYRQRPNPSLEVFTWSRTFLPTRLKRASSLTSSDGYPDETSCAAASQTLAGHSFYPIVSPGSASKASFCTQLSTVTLDSTFHSNGENQILLPVSLPSFTYNEISPRESALSDVSSRKKCAIDTNTTVNLLMDDDEYEMVAEDVPYTDCPHPTIRCSQRKKRRLRKKKLKASAEGRAYAELQMEQTQYGVFSPLTSFIRNEAKALAKAYYQEQLLLKAVYK